jgi:hypothetical protein
MKFVIEKEKLDVMCCNIYKITEKLTDLIDGYIPHEELKSYMYGLLNEIQFHVKEVYNQELVELKLQLEGLRQKVQLNKDNGNSIGDTLVFEHECIKQKIFEIENPFY